jgi:FtsH-binding integral membrane protein
MKLGFVPKLIVITTAIAVCTAAFLYFSQAKEQWWFWAALLFYFIAGLLIGKRTQKAVTSESNSRFFTGVMGGTGLRMLLTVLYIVAYLVLSEFKATEFIVYYLILYLVFTIFEIRELVSLLRNSKNIYSNASIVDDKG